MLSPQTAAVEAFSEWLTKLVVEKEVAKGNGGGAGKAKVVLCGHRYVLLRGKLRVCDDWSAINQHGWTSCCGYSHPICSEST